MATTEKKTTTVIGVTIHVKSEEDLKKLAAVLTEKKTTTVIGVTIHVKGSESEEDLKKLVAVLRHFGISKWELEEKEWELEEKEERKK
jgi:hypothetical protein